MVLLAFSFFFLSLMAVSILLGLSISIVTSAGAVYIANLSKNGSHGSAMGMLGSIMDIGHTTGPMLGGVLAVFLVDCLFPEWLSGAYGQCHLFYLVAIKEICKPHTLNDSIER
jgi:MFS family permease